MPHKIPCSAQKIPCALRENSLRLVQKFPARDPESGEKIA
jgi:hypothetical protein